VTTVFTLKPIYLSISGAERPKSLCYWRGNVKRSVTSNTRFLMYVGAESWNHGLVSVASSLSTMCVARRLCSIIKAGKYFRPYGWAIVKQNSIVCIVLVCESWRAAVIPMTLWHWDRIQRSRGVRLAGFKGWHQPDWQTAQTRDFFPWCRYWISWMGNGGTAVERRAFQSVDGSTESTADLMSN